MNKRFLLLTFCFSLGSAYAQDLLHHLDAPTLAAHKHFASGPYFALDFVADLMKALTLRVRNPHAMRSLYALSGGMKGLNAVSSLTSTFAPIIPSRGYGPGDARLLRRRFIAGLCSIYDVADASEAFKMVGRSGVLARLYKQKPELRKQLNKTSNKRLLNRAIAFAIGLGSFLALEKFRSAETRTAMPSWLWASFIYDLTAHGVLDKKGEDHGLEERLLKQAKRELRKEKKEAQEDEDELARLEAELLGDEEVAG